MQPTTCRGRGGPESGSRCGPTAGAAWGRSWRGVVRSGADLERGSGAQHMDRELMMARWRTAFVVGPKDWVCSGDAEDGERDWRRRIRSCAALGRSFPDGTGCTMSPRASQGSSSEDRLQSPTGTPRSAIHSPAGASYNYSWSICLPSRPPSQTLQLLWASLRPLTDSE